MPIPFDLSQKKRERERERGGRNCTKKEKKILPVDPIDLHFFILKLFDS